MSLGGKSSSSSSNTTTNVDTTTSTVDNRVTEGNAAVGGNVTTGSGDINGSLHVTTTDQGAVKGGVDIALESLRKISDSTSGSLAAVKSVASDSIGQAYGLANQARQSETSGAINNFLKYGVWVAIAGIAAFVIVKSGKA
jgi:hypothetical protein